MTGPASILVVAPFAPYRDGIAAYAVQDVKQLRSEGNQVDVCSPLPSAARHHLPVGSASGLRSLVLLSRDYDRVIVHFYPELIFGQSRSPRRRLLQWTLLRALAKVTHLEIRIHELEYEDLRSSARELRAARAALTSATAVVVHTDAEQTELKLDVGVDAEVVDHGRSFAPRFHGTKSEARDELGVPQDEHIFLSIGFLQEHKGFDRSIAAFRSIGCPASARLYIVGSARVDHPEIRQHVAHLSGLASVTDGVEVREHFVGDVEFDQWLTAADTLVLPYREIWSSGVVERAKMFGVTILASSVGGLADQLPVDSVSFKTDRELVAAMAGCLGIDMGDAVDEWQLAGDRPDRDSLQAQVAERAGQVEADSMVHGAHTWSPLSDLGEPLRQPAPESDHVIGRMLKNMVRKLTWWQIEPVYERLRQVQVATLEAFQQAERQAETSAGGKGSGDPTPDGGAE